MNGSNSFCVYNDALYYRANYNGVGNELWALKDTTGTAPTGIVSYMTSKGKVFKLYPNPAKDRITIITQTSYDKGLLEIRDIAGRLVHAEQLHDVEHTVSLQSIPAGTYMVSVVLDNKRNTEKLVVE